MTEIPNFTKFLSGNLKVISKWNREEDNINLGKRYRAAVLELIIRQELKDLAQVNLP
jgi:hypothetical protein